MKKLRFILPILAGALALGACDPLEEEIDQINAESAIVKDLEFTLSSDDYAMSSNENVATYENFSTEDEAAELIPEILSAKYPALGVTSSAIVTYNLYNPVTTVNNEESYTLTEQDYEDLGQTYGNLSSEDDVVEAVAFKFPDAEEGDLVTLTYLYWTGSEVVELTSKVIVYGGEFTLPYEPTEDDYYYLGQSYPNFESRTTARERIAILFDELYKFDDEGAIRTAVFVYTYEIDTDDDGEDDTRVFEDYLAVFEFDGTSWSALEDVVEIALSFAHDGAVWVADNTIKYSLTGDDYTAIAEAYATSNASGSESMASYSNYDIGLWSDDEIFESITNRLSVIFPETVEGQKYAVTYDTWEPGNGTGTLLIIFEGGEFVMQ